MPSVPSDPTSGSSYGLPIATTGAVTRRLKISETVARRVVGDIIRGGLQPGDMLPAEGVMRERYGVSRESLREGLRLLEVQGLLTIKRGPGGGPVVAAVDPANLGRISTLHFQLVGGTYRELVEMWALAESELAARAARMPDADRRRSAMRPFIEASGPSPPHIPKFVTEHATFHAVVGSLCGNRVLELWLQTIGLIISRRAILDDPRALHSQIESDHRLVGEAISAGDADLARATMHRHVMSVSALLSAEFAGSLDDHIEWR